MSSNTTQNMVQNVCDRIYPALCAQGDNPFVLAIEGGSGTGKSTLAGQLAAALSCPVIHTDDFFLPPRLRTAQRLAEPGGNFHYERFRSEVVLPLLAGNDVCYRVFSCKQMDYTERIYLGKPRLLLVEGCYSMHPLLREMYAYKIFLTAPFATRLRRIEERSGSARLADFTEKWIPLEDLYFSRLQIESHCDLTLGNL